MNLTTDSPRVKFSGPIVVGKDILELLSSAMYVDPLSIYREYLQNAADSIDELAEDKIHSNGCAPAIEITVSPIERWAKVRDNGMGVPKATFTRTLTAIGGSRKRGTTARGFRGVGRLAGLGYCQELIMRSKTLQDGVVTSMHWDCRRLKELLRDPDDLAIDQILSEIVTIGTIPTNGFPPHFFEIEMRNVGRYKNDILLNEAALGHYLSQVGPVPFSPGFGFGKRIQEFLAQHGTGKTYNVSLNGKPIYRPYKHRFHARQNVESRFTDLELYSVPGLSSGTVAVGWVLHSDYQGAIPDRLGINGLRLRIGNVQIGEPRLLDEAFPEPRFNAWAVGECHVISPRLIPNARRDNFEQDNHYANLINHLTLRAKTIAKACRVCSAERTSKRMQTTSELNGPQPSKAEWDAFKKTFSQIARKPVSTGHRRSIQKMFRAGGTTYSELMRLLYGLKIKEPQQPPQ